MANFRASLKITLEHEGGFLHDKQTGECSNYGISHWFLRSIGVLERKPEDFNGHGQSVPTPARADEVAFIRRLPKEIAEGLYQTHFWEKYRIEEILDDELAAKVFDLCVNMGPGGWVRRNGKCELKRGGIVLLQQSVNQVRASRILNVDGILGNRTVGAVNTTNADALLNELRRHAEQYYRDIARANANLAKNLTSWLARLAA